MISSSIILPTAYWGNIQYFTKVLFYNDIAIELHETYPKQTYRNRCEIYTANGKKSIQVPVKKGSFKNILLCNIEISYDTNWRKNHIKTIEAAYRSTPFFEYYFDDILPIYNKKFKFLTELNNEILNTCLDWFNTDKSIGFTNTYEKYFSGLDFRNSFSPKPSKQIRDLNFSAAPYFQGFEQRFGFVENLSVLDAVFNLGNDAVDIIKRSFVS